jgi:CheY-like chemotaxis protein
MTPARILVVEDDRVVAMDIQHRLTRIGHTVVGVTPSGEDAVRLALESHPDLVLMDIRLEGALDGIDAAQQIRDRCQVPVVYLTAYADDYAYSYCSPCLRSQWSSSPALVVGGRTGQRVDYHIEWRASVFGPPRVFGRLAA